MEFYGVERYATGGMHVLSVRPVLVRVDNAAVDLSERRNPEISSRIVILAQRVSFCGCMIVAARLRIFSATHFVFVH